MLSRIVDSELSAIETTEVGLRFGLGSGIAITCDKAASVSVKGNEVSVWTRQTGWTSPSFKSLLHRSVEAYDFPAGEIAIRLAFQDDWLLAIHADPNRDSIVRIYGISKSRGLSVV